MVKQFDQQKQSVKSLNDVFDINLELLRSEIVENSTALIYQTEYEAIGKKSREILWFKGYYDLISIAKRLWKKNENGKSLPEDQMSNLIIEGIAHFKSVVVKLERKFELDLRNIVDFSFLDAYEKSLYTSTALVQFNGSGDERRASDEINKYAMETIHAMLISLGDLHRYFIDFNFNMPKISKDFAANYYFEAFKLDPKTGMAHNQLGTLLSGVNYGLDSIYHYLYSLICPVPFELSDINVTKLFQTNSKYLERDENTAIEKCDTIGVRDFIARYILIVDVFFYDKEINDFNALCHFMIVDFRKMLRSKRMDLNTEIIYKMIAILLFCVAKLKSIGSNKIHHLNAFLVAICAEMVSACTAKLEEFIEERSYQNEIFQTKYGKLFEIFERNVRAARDKHKKFIQMKKEPKTGECNERVEDEKLSFESVDSMPNGKPAVNGNDALTGSSGHERESGKMSASSSSKNKKKGNLRRRRRCVSSGNSDSDLSYYDNSDSECNMDTDFSSDDDTADENDELSSNDEGDEDKSKGNESNDDDDDIVIEEEELVYGNNDNNSSVENGHLEQIENVAPIEPDNVFDNFVKNLNKLNLVDDASNSDDIIIENEELVYDHNDVTKIPKTEIDSNEKDRSAGNTDSEAPEKLRYKQKYNKIDPNIIISFGQRENTMKALKILFDWLRINGDILINCYATNPEFIEKIFVLLNYMNIDIFTRKVFFERELIENDNIRDNLRMLFDVRAAIPLTEDVLLKEFSVLDQCQHSIDWTLPLKMNIHEDEETALRIFKSIDFGFSLCKMKKFRYNFCSRNRKFIQMDSSSNANNIVKRLANSKPTRGKRRRRNRSRNRNKNSEFPRNNACDNINGVSSSNDDREALEENEGKRNCLKKGYLKNRQNFAVAKAPIDTKDTDSDAKPIGGKHEIMGKLWLQHEIEELEAKMSKKQLILTPYLVVDTKALTNHLAIVKNLVKAKKFVVLIPKAGKLYKRFIYTFILFIKKKQFLLIQVLTDLDELKKTSEYARNSIRWLEREFTKGSRFIRLQRKDESKALSLIKIPKKLGKNE